MGPRNTPSFFGKSSPINDINSDYDLKRLKIDGFSYKKYLFSFHSTKQSNCLIRTFKTVLGFLSRFFFNYINTF